MKKLYTRLLFPTFYLSLALLVQDPAKSYSQSLGGIDFWGTFPLNNTTLNPINQLVLISGCDTKGQVIFPSPAPTVINFNIVASVPMIINMPLRNNDVYETVQNNGFHIVSDSLIAAYMINYQPATVDGETLLPTPMLGTSYVISDYSDSRNVEFTIVATQNNTQVTITTNRPTSTGRPANTPWTITLNAGQTYMVGGTAGVNFTGSRVNSNKPIAVIGHTPCSGFVCGACDMLMVELLPVSLWGTRYITTQSLQRNNMASSMADHVEIIAGPGGSTVTINNWAGNAVYTLAPYGSMRYVNPKSSGSDEGKANLVINATNPVQVVQYSQGWGCDNSGTTDPESIMIYPESMWISEGEFASSTTLTSASSGVDIVINDVGSPSPITTLTLDGIPMPSAGWTQIGTSTYKSIRTIVPPGRHTVKSTAGYPFGIYMFAIGTAESYCVQGGTAYSDHICSQVVPIDLISFNATIENSTAVNLRWITASEVNSDYFQVERSVDNGSWQKIATINAKGNTPDISYYSFTDQNPLLNSDNYYRLRQVDFSGEEHYSRTVTVNIRNASEWLSMSPTLLKQGETIRMALRNEISGNLEIKVTDIQGKIVLEKDFKLGQGITQMDLETGTLPPGIYTVQIFSAEGKVVKKIGIN